MFSWNKKNELINVSGNQIQQMDNKLKSLVQIINQSKLLNESKRNGQEIKLSQSMLATQLEQNGEERTLLNESNHRDEPKSSFIDLTEVTEIETNDDDESNEKRPHFVRPSKADAKKRSKLLIRSTSQGKRDERMLTSTPVLNWNFSLSISNFYLSQLLSIFFYYCCLSTLKYSELIFALLSNIYKYQNYNKWKKS